MISVIVPIYKVEEYIRRCVDSILAQTYTDFELLLVDDGSPDKCPEICDEYARQDKRIRVFHKQNGGLSDARNYGLARMKGEYVSFIDSDDYVGPDYLKTLLELIEEKHVKVSMVKHFRVSDKSMSFVSSKDTRGVILNHEIMRSMAQNRLIFSAWGKLISAELVSPDTFPVGYLFEDNLSIPYILCQCSAVAYSTSYQYYWYKRSDSIMGTISKKKFYDWETGIDKILDFTRQKYPKDLPYVEGWVVMVIWHIVIDQSIYTPHYNQYAQHITEKYGTILKKARKLPTVNWKRKLKASFFLLSPSLYGALRKGWRIIRKK